MKKEDFHFDLPEVLIAQKPLKKRSESRLMVLNKKNKTIEHCQFSDLINYLNPGDVLVRNNTKVLPARLFGMKEETGAKVEVLLLKEMGDTWLCLLGNAKVVKEGTLIIFSDTLSARCTEVQEEGLRVLEMIYEGNFYEILDAIGIVPLPPYIKEKLDDKERYQTVYAEVGGSAAAPTAGLHFTEEIFSALKEKGIQVCDITLHVGLGTFKPMKSEVIEEHIMHEEMYSISEETAKTLNDAKEKGNRIICIGTTSARTLESVWKKFQCFKADSDVTSIFIYPGVEVCSFDGLVTNFHLPESTLILLISAFAGTDFIRAAYEEAIAEKYRFFSFGDAMVIL